MSYLMTNDVIFAKNVCWFRSTYIAHKQFIFSQLLKLRWHTRIYEVTFHVNSSANNANYLKFYSGKVESTAIATLAIIIPEISDSNLETRRYSPNSGVSGIIRKSWQHCTHDRNRFSYSIKNILKRQADQLTLTITIPKEGKNEQQTTKENSLFHFNFLTEKTNKPKTWFKCSTTAMLNSNYISNWIWI